jgi:hypothetical protein
MKTILIAIVIHLNVSLVSAHDMGIEKGWKGIKLFETTRTDIEHIMGTKTGTLWPSLYGPSKDNDGALANAAFSKGPCVGDPTDASRYNIEKDRLVAIGITFGNAAKFSDQKLQQKYTKADNAGHNGWLYTNEDGSIVIWTLKFSGQDEIVFNVTYRPTAEQKAKYKCS